MDALDLLSFLVGAATWLLLAHLAVGHVLHGLWELFHWEFMAARRRLRDARLGIVPAQLTTSVAVSAFEAEDDTVTCAACGSVRCVAHVDTCTGRVELAEHDNRSTLEAKEAIEARRLGALEALTLRMEILAAQADAEVRRPLTSDERKAVATRVRAALQEVNKTHPKT